MSEQFEMIAKTFQGLEEILAEELTALGANDIQIGRRMVSFTGDKRMMYKANFCLRTAIRILKPIKNFTAKDADEVYNQIQAIPWEEYLDVNKTFAIDAVVFSEEFRHSKFVSYKVKDAIVDYFREKTGKRPSVRINNPDVLLNIHIAQTTCTLSLDSSGESLHRRGYRQEAVEAPLNEVLAAGMILMTGWRGECDKLQPFQQFEQPKEKSIIITNPPYGERISTNDLLGLYQMIGERLKHAFVGNEAWVLSYREECFDQIGLKASQKVPLFNGPLECEFRKYEIFDGKYKEFKSQEEGEEKKEGEGEQAPRFRERKEFKPRREGEFKPRRDGESRPRREGEYKPRREGGDFKGGDEKDRKPRGEFRGGRDSRGPREFRGNREPRIPKKEEE